MTPRDTEAWKDLNVRYPEFGVEPRNVRMGLASDGFNFFYLTKFRVVNMSSCAYVIQFPPWLCMKQPFIILSVLVPEKYAPDNDIDVYLESLIDELKVLWTDGVRTYDAYVGPKVISPKF